MTLDPLQFRCTSCGECCRRWRVAVTHRDLERLISATRLEAIELVDWLAPEEVDMSGEPQSFVELREGRRLMVLRQAEGACIFLGSDRLCSVYESRPADCRLFPFDVVRTEPDRTIRLLPVICSDHARDGENDRDEVLERDAERWAELASFQSRVAAYNRLVRHRRRFGHRLGSGAEFLEYLGLLSR